MHLIFSLDVERDILVERDFDQPENEWKMFHSAKDESTVIR
jgi:hypothetical protein